MYIIEWEQQDSVTGAWEPKARKTDIYPHDLVIGFIARTAKTGVRWFKVVIDPPLNQLEKISELPANKIILSFYT